MKTGTWVLVALAISLVAAASAQAKFRFSFSIAPTRPVSGHVVRAVFRADSGQAKDCHMRLLAVAPGVDVYEALRREGELPPAASSRLGLSLTLTRTGPATWRGTFRFPRAGAWRLVLPNLCAPGYAIPPPLVRSVTVRAG